MIDSYTVRPTLRILGIDFMVIILAISNIMKLPPQDWQPTPKVATTSVLIAWRLFWFCLGGWLALAPTTTLRLFNPDDYAQN